MQSDWANLAGHVHTTFDLKALAIQLETTGLQVKIATRFSATPVDYIHIHEGDDFTVQQVSPDHYFAEGLSSSVETDVRSSIPSVAGSYSTRHQASVRGA